MIDRLLGLWRGTPPPNRVLEYVDPVLGRLVLPSDSPEWWEAMLTVGGRPVRIGVGGSREPDPTLLARAREIALDFDGLERRLASFLEREARDQWDLRAWAEEIGALKVEGVHLSWPDRPADGTVFFDGPSPDRLWRCEFAGAEFRDLAFDR